MSMTTLIPNHQHLEAVLQKMIADGKDHFHVIADFDRTLTKAFVDGKPRLSLESLNKKDILVKSIVKNQKKTSTNIIR